jgi:hypothetical protein
VYVPPDPLDGPPLRWWELALVPVLAASAVAVFLVATAALLALETCRVVRGNLRPR